MKRFSRLMLKIDVESWRFTALKANHNFEQSVLAHYSGSLYDPASWRLQRLVSFYLKHRYRYRRIQRVSAGTGAMRLGSKSVRS